MTKAKNWIPPGYHTVTPLLCVEGAAEALELYKKAFGAVEKSRAMAPSGEKIWHAEFMIGTSVLFINDAIPGMAEAFKANNWLYVEHIDAFFKQAVDAGMKAMMPPADMFWGDRHARVSDKFGNVWALATHTDDFTEAEMKEREAAFTASMSKQPPGGSHP